MKQIKTTSNRGAPDPQRGSASLTAMLAVTVLLGVSGTVVVVTSASHGERSGSLDTQKAMDVANSGAAHAVANMSADIFGTLGSEEEPVTFADGNYWVNVFDQGNDHYTVTSTGRVRRQERTVEVVVAAPSGGIYTNAVFAGNSSDDPLYTLELGGTGDQADEIGGDVYSGGDVAIEGDATVAGTTRASGVVTGTAGESNVSQYIPDLGAMDYAGTADIDVMAEFLAGATYASDEAGGSAYQVAEESPAHIFRANPSDRDSECDSTEKADFFLEDPYEPVHVDRHQDGSDAYRVSLSGVGNEAGPDSNQKVFYIDGNLWLHNRRSYSLGLMHSEPDGVQVTFVVSGNIYFGDNFFYQDAEHDGVAFIAMTDPDVEDSGNIYFGDPVFGTLQAMQAFMYAENDFHDMNLDESGSAQVAVRGNMTAGNRVLIERDYGDSHTKLSVDFDDRIMTGSLEMPGLPTNGDESGQSYEIVSWRVVASP